MKCPVCRGITTTTWQEGGWRCLSCGHEGTYTVQKDPDITDLIDAVLEGEQMARWDA